MNESSFAGVGGYRIFTRSWHPTNPVPRAVVVIMHGFNAHSGQYRWVGEEFASRGLAAYAMDMRGRGKSDGERFYIDRFDDYVADLATFIQQVKASEPGRPVFLLGHSAGGVVSCVYALEHQSELAGLVCESFAHEVPAPDFALAALKGLSHVAPHAHVLRLHNEDFSRDPRVVEALNADPLIANEVQPTQTVAEMVRADERLRLGFPSITLPVLILHGTADKVTRPSGSQRFYDAAGSQDKTLKLYEGHAHDLLNDYGREEVFDDIEGCITARIPAA